MADIQELLQNSEFLHDFNMHSRAERAKILGDNDPSFHELAAADRFKVLDNYEQPFNAEAEKARQSDKGLQDVTVSDFGPIAFPALKAATSAVGPAIIKGAGAAAGPVGSFASRVKNFLTGSSRGAGAAINEAERAQGLKGFPMSYTGTKELYLPLKLPGGGTYKVLQHIPNVEKSASTLGRLADQADFVTNLENSSRNAASLPKGELFKLIKTGDMIKDKLPLQLQSRTFDALSKLKDALNSSIPERAVASQNYADIVRKRSAVINALKFGAKWLGAGALGTLGVKGAGSLFGGK
jgi:hypothetical protein